MFREFWWNLRVWVAVTKSLILYKQPLMQTRWRMMCEDCAHCSQLRCHLGIDGKRCSAPERSFVPFGDLKIFCVWVAVLFQILVFNIIVSVSWNDILGGSLLESDGVVASKLVSLCAGRWWHAWICFLFPVFHLGCFCPICSTQM